MTGSIVYCLELIPLRDKKIVQTTPTKQNSGTFSLLFSKFLKITPVIFIGESPPLGLIEASCIIIVNTIA